MLVIGELRHSLQNTQTVLTIKFKIQDKKNGVRCQLRLAPDFSLGMSALHYNHSVFLDCFPCRAGYK